MLLRYFIILLTFGPLGGISLLHAQQEQQSGGQLSGDLDLTANFFQRDTLIGAANTPQYDRQLYGANGWLQLNYSNWGFQFGVRFDVFNNSNLLNPTSSYTAQGIGRWFVKKQIDKFKFEGGYIYDQIGSGIIFRAFEQRPLLIDNALFGLKAEYEITKNWSVKGFTGRQKVQFDTYNSIIHGGSIQGYQSLNESGTVAIAPGFGVTVRTLDDPTMTTIVNTIGTYSVIDSFVPKYNTYAYTLYNTLTAGDFTWFIEGAIKTDDTFFDPFATKTNRDGSKVLGKLVQRPGNILYTSLGYAKGKWGVTLEYKRTKDFTFRTNPFVSLNRGIINFLPPMARVNTFRLNARYQPATQELGEQALQLDLRYRFSKKLSFNVNVSNITDLNKALLYREFYSEILYKPKNGRQITAGIQMQAYNQEIYETKPNKGIVGTFTPYVEYLHKFSKTKALRLEVQHMTTGVNWNFNLLSEDNSTFNNLEYGSWVFALAEFTIAPHWTFTVSDMFNFNPNEKLSTIPKKDGEVVAVHYPRFDVFYTHKANRISLSYVKQVEGVVCTGGICRLEPAFSGVRLTISSTF